MVHKVKVEVGSGSIFADLGLPDANTHLLKAQIVSESRCASENLPRSGPPCRVCNAQALSFCARRVMSGCKPVREHVLLRHFLPRSAHPSRG